MCGFLFGLNNQGKIKFNDFKSAFESFSWRGPDNHKILSLNDGGAFLGHHRLTIIEPNQNANQPMLLKDGKTYLLFNGEIYNHQEIRERLNLNCNTGSDTETIADAYLKVGDRVFEMLDGMFSIVLYNSESRKWIATRDAFGIKPLFIHRDHSSVIIGSEPAPIAKLSKSKISAESVREWELIRRPLPGFSFFEGVEEVKPGTIIDSSGHERKHWAWEPEGDHFSQEKFENLLAKSIRDHELSDCENVGLLSGGLDSAIIARVTERTNVFYSVGLENNNEFDGARDTASEICKPLKQVVLEPNELECLWRKLTKLRGEPLSLPNEGLIYKVCSAMEPQQKVVLTGEGADELLFGYDNIFRWAINAVDFNYDEFLFRYGYSENRKAPRLEQFFYDNLRAKKPIEFLEDFFYLVHLPGLLRRMDFASMAASKEARVPFVSKELISYLYRKPAEVKISNTESKIPVRDYARKLNLHGALSRKKIGFSAKIKKDSSRTGDYTQFQKTVMGALEW